MYPFGRVNLSRWKVNVTVDAEVKAEGQVQVQVAADVMVEAVLSNLTVGVFAQFWKIDVLFYFFFESKVVLL
ncbi:hypothetical protein SGCOL_010674 [Colletotrichum sp. CLE4]